MGWLLGQLFFDKGGRLSLLTSTVFVFEGTCEGGVSVWGELVVSTGIGSCTVCFGASICGSDTQERNKIISIKDSQAQHAYPNNRTLLYRLNYWFIAFGKPIFLTKKRNGQKSSIIAFFKAMVKEYIIQHNRNMYRKIGHYYNRKQCDELPHFRPIWQNLAIPNR